MFLLIFTIFCEIAMGLAVLFIIVNWYINIANKEDLHWRYFIPYLKCEFYYEAHDYHPQGVESYMNVEGGREYKVCSRCTKTRAFWVVGRSL